MANLTRRSICRNEEGGIGRGSQVNDTHCPLRRGTVMPSRSLRFYFATTIVLLSNSSGTNTLAEDPSSIAVAPAERAKITGPLADYLAKQDESYRWEQIRADELDGVEYAELILTSQTWRETAWKHRLFVIKPETLVRPSRRCWSLLAAGGSPNSKTPVSRKNLTTRLPCLQELPSSFDHRLPCCCRFPINRCLTG